MLQPHYHPIPMPSPDQYQLFFDTYIFRKCNYYIHIINLRIDIIGKRQMIKIIIALVKLKLKCLGK